MSQLHALEPARYAVIIPANTYYVFVFSFHIRSGSVPHDLFNRDGTPVAAQKFRTHVLGQICLDSGTTLKSNAWPLLKLSQLHVLS